MPKTPAPAATESSRTPGRPRGRDSDCRQRLLDAALQAFATGGYDATSLRKVAAGAACDVSMVAHYFGSKLELWQAIVDTVAARIEADREPLAARLYAPGIDIHQRLRAGVEHLFDQIAAHQQFARLILRELTQESARAQYVEDRLLKPSLALYAPLWSEAMQAGALGPIDPVIAHMAMTGSIALLISSLATVSRLGNTDYDLPRLRDAFCQCVLRQVGAGW